jgi:RNA polymerase sigma-70 factor, ECF subfamily
MKEQTLIKKAKKGDENAFGSLYETYLSAIYRFIFLKVGNKADAEDITHQVFLRAWKTMPRYKDKGFPFSSWLYKIARNAVIDHYRTTKHHTDIETIPEDLHSENPNFNEKIDTNIQMNKVRTALSHLEGDQKTVLIMKFVNDLPNKEIARLVGKSEGAIRVIQHRALKQLKKHI